MRRALMVPVLALSLAAAPALAQDDNPALPESNTGGNWPAITRPSSVYKFPRTIFRKVVKYLPACWNQADGGWYRYRL